MKIFPTLSILFLFWFISDFPGLQECPTAIILNQKAFRLLAEAKVGPSFLISWSSIPSSPWWASPSTCCTCLWRRNKSPPLHRLCSPWYVEKQMIGWRRRKGMLLCSISGSKGSCSSRVWYTLSSPPFRCASTSQEDRVVRNFLSTKPPSPTFQTILSFSISTSSLPSSYPG